MEMKIWFRKIEGAWRRPTGGLLIFFFIIGPMLSQQEILHFEKFSDDEGLPNNLFTEIIQDRYGLLWMVGLDGLARFDGYSVKSYRHNHLDSTTLSGNKLSTIYEDRKGRLWIGVFGSGVDVSDPAREVFKRVGFPIPAADRLSLRINDITEDQRGVIWIASNLGLFICTEEGNEFIIRRAADILKNFKAYEIFTSSTVLLADTSGRIFIGTDKGLILYDPSSPGLVQTGDELGLPAARVTDIETDRHGVIWVAFSHTDHRLYFADSAAKQFHSFTSIPFRRAGGDLRIAFDLDNRMWGLVFGDQAYGFDFRDSTLFLQSAVNSDIAHERFFRKPFVDHSGNAWLPVEGFNIYAYPKGFKTFKHPYAFHQSNSCIYGAEDKLYFGYREKGIVIASITTGTTTHLSTTQPDVQSIPVDHIQDILRLKDGHILMAGFGTIFTIQPEGGVVSSFPLGGTNRALYQDRLGRIWIGGYAGLHLFSPESGILKTYAPAIEDGQAHFIQTIVEDHVGNLWFASDLRGLCRLNTTTWEVTQFLPIEGDRDAMPSISVLDLALDHQGNIWAATDVALVKFNPVTFQIKAYNHHDGLESDYISSVVCTKDGAIWLSTHAGISRFDPEKNTFTNYSRKDGLSNVSYYTRSRFYADDGMLYFGGKNGVDYFHPDRLRTNETSPIMFLSSLKIDNRRTISGYSLQQDQMPLELTYQDKLLEFEISGLHYAGQEDVTYQYKMEGLHEEWVDLGRERTILFSNLPPGKYLFKARASSADGIWSASELRIPLYISPPFYATAWFTWLSALLILGGVVGIIRYREFAIKRKDKLEAEVKQKLIELERRALQAQMNPHFIYNCMNSIQQFMILHDMEGAMKYLTKFSRLLRNVMHFSAQHRIPLSEEIVLIKDYLDLESMRFPDKFTYAIQIAENINTHAIEIPPFFIQPQVENAIRHGLLRKQTPGHLRIEMTSTDDHLRITVEDNGIGRDAARKLRMAETTLHESRGLAILEERLTHIAGNENIIPFKVTDLFDNHHQPAGTRVEIYLPLD